MLKKSKISCVNMLLAKKYLYILYKTKKKRTFVA